MVLVGNQVHDVILSQSQRSIQLENITTLYRLNVIALRYNCAASSLWPAGIGKSPAIVSFDEFLQPLSSVVK